MQLARAAAVAALALLVAACDTARNVEETAAVNDCARCHGFPPPDPHPQATNCDLCHATTVGPGNVIIAGGTHMDGQVETTVHAMPFVAQHTSAALPNIDSCTDCHGLDFAGGTAGVSCNACHAAQVAVSAPDWRTNCTFCHGTRTANWTDANLPLAAPPQSVSGAGDQSSANPKVGAHQAHLVGTTYVNPLPCTSCHGVPVRQFPGSLDHITGTVEIAFSGLANTGVAAAWAGAGGTCAVYCHGSGTAFVNRGAAASTNVSPAWTNAAAIGCTDCHGTPPTTGEHGIANHAFPCNRCHVEVAGSGTTPTITNKALHVNGTKNVAFTVSGSWDATQAQCSNIACHGGAGTRSWYP